MLLPDTDELAVARFVTAFENADLDAFVALLRDDVKLEMPPVPSWFIGRAHIATFYARWGLRAGRRCVVVSANGCPAVAAYQPDEGGVLRAHSIQVLELVDGLISHVYAFLDPSLFRSFGLPEVRRRRGHRERRLDVTVTLPARPRRRSTTDS